MGIPLLLGALVGAVLGLTGAGGGVLAVPALVSGMGWSVQQAAPVALIAVATGASLGAFDGLRKGLVRYKAAIVMVLCGAPFTKVGMAVAQRVPQSWLLALFAGLTLTIALRLIRQTMPSRQQGNDRALARINPQTGRFRWTWRTGFFFAGFGAFIGFLSGLLGVGGGFLIVPAMRRFTDATMHGIVATSLMVVALISSSGVVVAIANGAQFPWPATALFAGATALGMGVGRKLSSRLSETTIQRGFALVLLGSAASMIGKASGWL